MNETLKRYWEQVRNYLTKMPKQKRIIAASSAALILTTAVAAVVFLRHDPYQILYSELRDDDAKAVAKKLSESKIPYHVGEDRSSISVPRSKVHVARMELAKEGLPGQDVVGFEKFDASTLGMSSYVQRIQYIRAVQGELTRSIQRLASVKNARVHISIPPKKTFLEDDEPPKASVVMELRPGQAPSKQETKGIAHLVASAVEGMKVSNITIVDTKGNFLHRPEEDSAPIISTALLEMQRSIETEYERRVEDMLTPVIGFGKVRAKVTAEMDPSRVNTTEETFDPQKVIPRTTSKTDEVVTGQRPNPIGIPGSRSNLPGTENNNSGMPMATSSTEKNSANTVNAIPRKIQVTDKPSGNIKRLTVAVVVDGYYKKGTGPNATDTFTPRPEEELRRLQDLVANAVGFDVQRRDSITVSSLPFSNLESLAIEEPAAPAPFSLDELKRHGVRNGLIGLLILTFFFMLVRPFTKWTAQETKRKKELESVPQNFPVTVAELEKAVQDQISEKLELPAAALKPEVLMSSDAEPKDESLENLEKLEQEELKAKILDRLQKFPKKGIRIVQDWLEEAEPQTSEG
jgi:flagellar M-ring protein FliF